MSRLIDKLNQLSRAAPESIGFRTKQPASPKPKIQLVASLAQESIEQLAGYVNGADAGLLRISAPSSVTEAFQKINQAVSDIPWGGWLQSTELVEIKEMIKAGCDFVVFPAANTPLTALNSDKVGKILEVEASLTEGLLRTVNELPIDAVLLIDGEQKEGYFLTWQHLMLFQRFANLLTKPLLVSIPSNVSAGELQALWKAGVDSVVIQVTVEQLPDRIKELRQLIDKLAFPLPRRHEKVEPLLPRMGGEPGMAKTEEEEEE